MVEKTIALGGVEIGIMNAQLAAKTTGKIILTISRPASIANVPSKGKSKKVVAVLLVNSVKIEVNKVKNNIIKNISKLFKKLMFFDISFANPVSMTKEAIANPPPKSIKTFQGMFLNHSALSIVCFFLLTGMTKNKNAQNNAIPESLKLIPKYSFIFALKIHKVDTIVRIKDVIFSSIEKLP